MKAFRPLHAILFNFTILGLPSGLIHKERRGNLARGDISSDLGPSERELQRSPQRLMPYFILRVPLLLAVTTSQSSFAAAVYDDCDVVPGSTQPQGVHLAFAGPASTSIAISFFTCALGSGGQPVAMLSSSSARGHVVVNGTSMSTERRHHHDILVNGLQPATTYTYRVSILPNASSFSAPFRFKTAATGTPGFVAAVIGDMGVNGSASTVARLSAARDSFNATLHVGDVAYADVRQHNLMSTNLVAHPCRSPS